MPSELRPPARVLSLALLVLGASLALSASGAREHARAAAETDFRLRAPFTRIAYGDNTRVCQLAMRFTGQIDEQKSYSFNVTFRLRPASENWPGEGIGGLHGSLVANRPEGRFVMEPELDLFGRRVGQKRVTYQRRTWRYLGTRRWVRIRATGWLSDEEHRIWEGERTWRVPARAMRRCTLGR